MTEPGTASRYRQAFEREKLPQLQTAGRTSLMAGADDHARTLLPLLRTLRAEGAITIGTITRSLNERKIATARGSRWHVASVANLLARVQKLEAVL